MSAARLAATAVWLASLGLPARAGEVGGAVVVLEAFTRTLPHHVPEAAPPRFALLEDGRVFVGGTRSLAAGKLESREQKELEKRLADVRKLPGVAGTTSLGPGEMRHRLRLFKGGRPLDLTLNGDPAQARPEMRALARLVEDLNAYSHPSLRPYAPESFALSARAGTLRGGCRRWKGTPTVAESVFAPVAVRAAQAEGWPTGATPASVCSGDQTYIMTLRPLLPGEQP